MYFFFSLPTVPLKRTQIFKKEDALSNATKYVKEILSGVPEHPCFSKGFRTVKLAVLLASLLLAAAGDEVFTLFCQFIVSGLWDVVTAGDKRPLFYAETLVIHFHAFRIDDVLLSKWDALIETLNISCGQLENDCILQHILDMLLERLITDRNSVDLPIMEHAINSSKLNKNEEQVLAYVAGYIPFAMRKHYDKLVNNSTACKYVDILTKWATDGPYTGQFSFLNYTRDWITAQNRGKLFQPNARVYLFFRAVENETRKHLNTTLMGKYRDVNLKELLSNKLSNNYLIQKYWTELVGNDLSCQQSKHLFNATILYFINIRCRAFVLVYIDLRRFADKIAKKGTKNLRQELSK